MQTSRIALVADLHFGSVPEGIAAVLRDDIMANDVDALVVAGDLTMRARSHEFEAARVWLDTVDIERIVVPGNHDIPAYNLIERFFSPNRRFDRATRPAERDPIILDTCAIFGLNTASSWQPHLRWQEGRVRRRDAKRLAEDIAAAPPDKLRIVAAHHPFAEVPDMPRAVPVRRAPTTLDLFREHAVDIVLSGHTHQSFALPIIHDAGHLLALGAPTALSDRTRSEPNGYWLIDVTPDEVRLVLRLFEGSKRLVPGLSQVHRVDDYSLVLNPDANPERVSPQDTPPDPEAAAPPRSLPPRLSE